MTIEFLHEDKTLTAVVVFNLHNTNIIMVKLRTQVEVFSDVIFFINTGEQWISDSSLETQFPSTYSNLISQLDHAYNLRKQDKENITSLY